MINLRSLFASKTQKQFIKQLDDIKSLIKAKNGAFSLNSSDILFDTELEKLISELKSYILKNKNLKSSTFDETVIRSKSFVIIVNYLDDKLSSGHYHTYRGTLGLGGKALYKILNIVLPLLNENGLNEDIELIKKNIDTSIANMG